MRITNRIITLGLVTFIVAGCATDDPNRRAKSGAAIGAIAGAVIGHQAHSKNGRYAGAAIGALTGAAVGHYMDGQQRRLEQSLVDERRNNEISLTRIDSETLKVELSSEASFDINSSAIKAGFRTSLRKVANVIATYDQTAVHVIGYTDSTGSNNYNQQLSEKRANAVSAYLGTQAVNYNRMRTLGRGEKLPIADNSTSAGRSANRRVEIYLKPFVKGRERRAFITPS